MLKKPYARIALGTVQFGMKYGISNVSGQVKNLEVKKILDRASDYNIASIDTAAVYGDSEEIIGNIGVSNFNVVTKLPAITSGVDISSWALICLNTSLKKLNLNKIYGLLVHRSEDLLGVNGNRLYKSLCSLKHLGLVQKIGVSIYSPKELDLLYENNISLDIVQSPFNIFDRRLKSSGWLERLKFDGVEVHIRSIFLQGLLLQKLENIDSYFYKWRELLNNFDQWAHESGLSRVEACVNFALSQKEIDKVIVGVLTDNQLKEIIFASEKKYNIKIPGYFELNDKKLINPTYWNIS